MKVIDLFSGLNGWGDPWREAGHEVFSIDFNPKFVANAYLDVGDTSRVLDVLIRNGFGRPDIILASPPCTSFSMMSVAHHWTKDGKPKSLTAMQGERLVLATLDLINALRPRFYVIENPRARLRTMPYLLGLDRKTVWYCRYGEERAKPTDLWGEFPPSWVPRPECKNGSTDHIAAPRGSKTGTQGGQSTELSAKIPAQLSNEIRKAAERDVQQVTMPTLREAIHKEQEPTVRSVILQ